MRKLFVSLSSLSFMILVTNSLVACTPLNDLQKSFNYNNNVTIDDKQFTLKNLGLQKQENQNIYNFYFSELNSQVAIEIVKVNPNQPVSKLYFQGNYPHESPNKNSEIAQLSGRDYSGTKGLKLNNNVVSIPLTLSLMDSYVNSDSSTGFSYQFTGLIMNIKINVIFN